LRFLREVSENLHFDQFSTMVARLCDWCDEAGAARRDQGYLAPAAHGTLGA